MFGGTHSAAPLTSWGFCRVPGDIAQKTKVKDQNRVQRCLFCVVQCCLYCLECCMDKINKNALIWVCCSA